MTATSWNGPASRKLISIRNDGRREATSRNGMDANSVLLILLATDCVNCGSFFDYLVRSAYGYD